MTTFAKNVTFIVDDLRPILTGFALDGQGRIVDLTGAISVKFFMYPRNEDGTKGVAKIAGVAGAIDADPTTGKVTYTWVSGDTDTEGKFIGNFTVYFGAASTIPQTFKAIGIRFAPIEEHM